jgi:hypothetical protein
MTSSVPSVSSRPYVVKGDVAKLPDRLSAPVLKAAGNKSLTALPAYLKCNRVDATNCTALSSIGPGLRTDALDVSGTEIAEIPADAEIGLRLEANQCQRLTRLPDGLGVGVLSLRECPALVTLPRGLQVSFLDLTGCSALVALPDDLRIHGGRLRVRDCPRLRVLPTSITLLSQLDIAGCLNITSLPDTLHVTSWIDVGGSGLTEVPPHLKGVGLRWRGVPVDERIAFRPETLKHDEVLSERNAEVRRVMLERYGLDRFMRDAKAETLDEDTDAGGRRRLLRLKLEGDEDLVCVTVICPSTDRQFVLRVPPGMRTCRQAIAWTAGYDDPSKYKPLVET